MASIEDTFLSPLQIVHGTSDALAAPVEDMGGNHGRLYIFVAQQFLHCPDVGGQFAFLGRLRDGRSTHLQALRRFNDC